LDRATTGAVLVTDDGDLNEAIRAALPKTYRIDVEGEVSADQLRDLCEGVVISHVRRGLQGVSVKTLPAEVDHVKNGLRMVLYEGRNRQVRRMCAVVKVRLVHLHRESVGPVACPPQEGAWSKVDPAVFDGLAPLRIQRYAEVPEARRAGADERELHLIDGWMRDLPETPLC
jgi:23S rRNA pseudouridine2605 synthase